MMSLRGGLTAATGAGAPSTGANAGAAAFFSGSTLQAASKETTEISG